MQKSMQRTLKLQDKHECSNTSLQKTKSMASGYFTTKEVNGAVVDKGPKNKSKPLNLNVANVSMIQSCPSDRSLPVPNTDKKSRDQNSTIHQSSAKLARMSIPSAIHTNNASNTKLSQKQPTNQPQKKRSVVQIDLVDQEQDEEVVKGNDGSNQMSREQTTVVPQIEPQLQLKYKRISNENSSFNDEQRTQRGSILEGREEKRSLKPNQAPQPPNTSFDKIEDPQQEKFKIWSVSCVDDHHDEVSAHKNSDEIVNENKGIGAGFTNVEDSSLDPFKQHVTDTKFTLTDSEVFNIAPNDQAIIMEEPSHDQCGMVLTTQTDLKLQTCESVPTNNKRNLQVDKSNDKNSRGPQRASKINRRSKHQRNEEQKDGQLSVNDIQNGCTDKKVQGGYSTSIVMDNHEYEEFEQQYEQFPCHLQACSEVDNDNSTQRAILPSQEKTLNQNIDQVKNDQQSTPNMNKSVNEKTIKLQLMLDGKSQGLHEHSNSEITQFNQKDFQSSGLDDTNMLNCQSRNASTTNPSVIRNQTQLTLVQTSCHVSPDNNKLTSIRRKGTGADIPATASPSVKDDVILMANADRESEVHQIGIDDRNLVVEQLKIDRKIIGRSAEQLLDAIGGVGSSVEKKHYISDKSSHITNELQSPQFGGINSKVELRKSVQNSGRQSLPNSVPQSSSGLDSTKIIEDDGQVSNTFPSGPPVSQYSTGDQHESTCQCAECFKKQELIQQKIEQIPFDIYAAPNSHRSNNQIKINFDALLEQHIILQQIRDLIEIRPSTVQNYSNLKSSFLSSQNTGNNNNSTMFESVPCTQAIEGLTMDERIKIQTLCQEWWDSTQEDSSIFKMALSYQQDLQEAYFRSSMQDQVLTIEERNLLNNQNYERSQCMRKQVVLSSVVIGMTAFFSMLTRHGKKDSTIVSCDSTVKQDLELRTRLSQLIKILYDQSMLCMSYALGKLAKYERVMKNRSTSEFKLHNIYNEYIHLLFINKKIQTEDDYQIFNHKGLMPQYPPDQYINNEENRDFQLGQLSRRLQENCYKIIEQELIMQQSAQNSGNMDLLLVLRDIVEHSPDIDFQEGKNHIFEGISNSEALLSTNNASQTCSAADENDEEAESSEGAVGSGEIAGQVDYVQVGGKQARGGKGKGHGRKSLDEEDDREGSDIRDKEYAVKELRAACQGAAGSGGQLLVKTFKDDINQIIQEESREESMSVSVSMINSSKIPPEAEGLYSQSVSIDRSRVILQGRTPKQMGSSSIRSQHSQQTHCGETQQDFDRMIEIQENVETELSPKNQNHVNYDSLERSRTLKLDDTDLRVLEPLRNSQIDGLTNDPFLQPCDSLITTSAMNSNKNKSEAPKFVRVSQLTNTSENDGNCSVKAPFLPPLKEGKNFTLVVDLEYTLIHSTLFSRRESKLSDKNQEEQEDLLVYQRPGLKRFLEEVSQMFEIVIFTSKGLDYASQLVKKCIGCEYIDHILYQDHLTKLNQSDLNKIQNNINDFYRGQQICSSEFGSSYLEPCDQISFDNTMGTNDNCNGIITSSQNNPHIIRNFGINHLNIAQEESANFVKDLSKLGRQLSKTIIVDRKSENFGWHLQNGICIQEYIVDDGLRKQKRDNDQSLDHLCKLLKQVYSQAMEQAEDLDQVDLRHILGEHLKRLREQKMNKQFQCLNIGFY